MSRTVLDSVAMAYQPVWNRQRLLAAVRLSVLPVNPDSVDAAHLMQILGDDWPVAAPVLILSLGSPGLLCQALACKPVPNTWLEVPASLFTHPESQAMLSVASQNGHHLLRHATLAELRGEFIPPLDARSLLRLNAEEAFEALKARPTQAQPVPDQRTPILPGHLYQNVCNRGLADHCLDEAGAWGLLGWPDEDVLYAWRHRPIGCDAVVIGMIRQAIDEDRSLDQLERFVRQDPVLCYRLLAHLNSAVFGGRHEVGSLRHALMMLGFSALESWLSQQVASCDSDAALHPVRYAQVMRSRLAQHLLEPGSEEDLRAEVYMTALFAQLERLLHQPLATLLGHLPLSERISDALVHHRGPYFPLLEVASAQSDVERLDRLPGICEQHEMSLEQVNRALLRMLSTSRDHGLVPAKQPS